MDAGLDARIFDSSQRERLAHHLHFENGKWDAPDVEVLITGWGAAPVGPAELDRMPALRAIFHSGGTVRSMLSREVWDRGILVTTASAANALPVAEFTLASILFTGKDVLAVAADYARDPESAGEVGASPPSATTAERWGSSGHRRSAAGSSTCCARSTSRCSSSIHTWMRPRRR